MNPSLQTLLQTLTDGIAVGAVYALIALGYTLVFGILQFINFAHSDIFALGSWLTCIVAMKLIAFGSAHGGFFAQPLVLGVVVPISAIAMCGMVGYCIERFAYRPLRQAPRLNVLITAIGVSLLLENLGQQAWAFGPYPKQVPQIIPDKILFAFGGVNFHLVDAAILVIALVLMTAIELVIYRTKYGMAMRAVSHSTQTASLMGISVNRVISLTFVTGSCLAASAGFLYAMKYPQLKQTADTVWVLLGLKAFIAAVVGGIGNVRGAMIGGMLIGLIEMFIVPYLAAKTQFGVHLFFTDYRDVYVFLVLILVLLIRPRGILGAKVMEKV